MKTSNTLNKAVKMNYLALGDLHLGHKNTPTQFMLDNLNSFIKENIGLMTKLDVIFIQGDLFDRLLNSHGEEYNKISAWFFWLGVFCVTHKIKLRFLKGTSSHDWEQINLLETALLRLKSELDFKYVKTLEIEYMKEYGVHVLYVPDEYKLKAKDTLEDVKALLREKGIEKVNIAIMHGMFKYQLPIESEAAHDPKAYLDLVTDYITINHIHIPSVMQRIIAPGSFDRVAHSEEEDKGCIHVTLFKNGERRFAFLKNKNAKIYKTIKCFNMELEAIYDKVRKGIKRLEDGSQIRILVNKDTHLVKNLEDFSKTFLNFNFKIEHEKDDKLLTSENIINIEEPIDSFHITKDNVFELLKDSFDKYGLTPEEYDLLVSELNGAISQV